MFAKRFLSRNKPGGVEQRTGPAVYKIPSRHGFDKDKEKVKGKGKGKDKSKDEKKHKQSRFSKFARNTQYTDSSEFKAAGYGIRKSLADLVQEEMSLLKRNLYYQRVFIIAKNKENLQIGTEIVDDKEIPIYKFDEKTFVSYFQTLIEKSKDHVIENTFSEDAICGLFLYMKQYTLLIVECTEDIVILFLRSLALKVKECWVEDRVALVDDNIGKTFFNSFITRTANPINVNEKFTPGVPNDEYLMGIQHCKIRDKLINLCKKLSQETRSSSEMKLESVTSKPLIEHLAPEMYNKHLPEVQRIEILLQSSKFYTTLDGFVDLFDDVPDQEDEYEMIGWPMAFNYVPMKPFQRMDKDFNITFAGYARGEGLTLDESDKEESDYGEDFDLPISLAPNGRYAQIMYAEEEEEIAPDEEGVEEGEEEAEKEEGEEDAEYDDVGEIESQFLVEGQVEGEEEVEEEDEIESDDDGDGDGDGDGDADGHADGDGDGDVEGEEKREIGGEAKADGEGKGESKGKGKGKGKVEGKGKGKAKSEGRERNIRKGTIRSSRSATMRTSDVLRGRREDVVTQVEMDAARKSRKNK